MHHALFKRYLSASLLAAILVAPNAFATDPLKLATRLLEISGINTMYAQGIVAGYKNSATTDNRPAEEVACFAAKITPRLTLQPLATGYATEFKESELQAAISFFESKIGTKYAKYQRVKASEMFGVTSQEKEPELTAGDIEFINAFLETRIGKLILGTNSPMSATAKAILRPQFVSFLSQCKSSASRG